MGCGCLKPNSLNNDKSLVVYVPDYTIIEPSENKEINEIKEKNSETNLIFSNRNNTNQTAKHLNLASKSAEKNKKENKTFIENENLNEILSKNSIVDYNNENKNNSILGRLKSNVLNQSSILEVKETRGKTFTKSIIESTTLNNNSPNPFDLDMLREINLIRTSPLTYSDKIKDFMKFINTDDKNNRKFILVNKKTKLNLLKGEEAFLNCLEILSELDNKLKSQKTFLRELELRDELKFPFPFDEPEKCISKEYIKETLLKLKSSMGFNFKMKGFHYDLSTNDPEISTVLQIVDDNNSFGKRRNMLLDETIKYIGINIGKLKDNLFCIYMVFAS